MNKDKYQLWITTINKEKCVLGFEQDKNSIDEALRKFNDGYEFEIFEDMYDNIHIKNNYSDGTEPIGWFSNYIDFDYFFDKRSEYEGYENLFSIVIPEGVSIIKGSFFNSITGLECIEFPTTLKNIESKAFRNCSKLKKVIFKSDPKIYKDAFSGCNNIIDIEIPKNIDYLKEGKIFNSCKNLSDTSKNNINQEKIIDNKKNETKKENNDILFSIKNDGSCFEYASEELKSDKEFVLKAIKNNEDVFKYISDELKNNKEFVNEAIKKNSGVIRFLPKEYLKDSEFLIPLIKKQPWALEYASDEIKNDKKIVLQIIRKYGKLIQFVGNELKKDKELILDAVRSDGTAFCYIDEDLKNDKDILKESLNNLGLPQGLANENNRKDSHYLLQQIFKEPRAFIFADVSIRKDKKFIINAINDYYFYRGFEYVDEELKNDKDILDLMDEKDREHYFHK